ncbi:cilia- and flagella-associated protein 157-like [Menidia menidia]
MPKKKEKKGVEKQKGNNKTSKTEGIPTSAFNIVSANKERDLYLTQIRYLNEELERFQLRCDDLEAKNRDLSCRYGSLEQEKRDVSGYLKHELSQCERQVEDLRRRLNGEQKEANREQSALKMEHAREREELQARIKELMQENSDILRRMAGLEAFQKQREDLEAKLKSVEEQLSLQEKKHRDEIHSLEMKGLMEKRSLEDSFSLRLAAVGSDLQQQLDIRLPAELRGLQARCARLQEALLGLEEQREAWRQRGGRLQTDREVLEEMLQQATRTSLTHKREAERLNQQLQLLQAEVERLRQDGASQSERGEETTRRLEAELQEEKKRRRRANGAMQEACSILRRALMEAPAGRDDQWEQLLRRLLTALERRPISTQQGPPPTAEARAAASEPNLTSRFLSTRQRRGLSSLGALSSSTLPLFRKPIGEKTPTSGNVTRSAVGFFNSTHSISKFKGPLLNSFTGPKKSS